MRGFEQAGEVYIPSIVVGELFFGAYNSMQVVENLARVEEFALNVRIIGCDATTSRYFGQVLGALQRAGRVIPSNDIWIAATVLQHGLTLATRDAHFRNVEGLTTAEW